MDPSISVLLYSKYSSLSKQLMDEIQASGVDFTGMFSLQSLCIDNNEIRQRIINDTQIKVVSVPCLLLIYPDGGIEKFDGQSVFQWFGNMIEKLAPPPVETQAPEVPQTDTVKNQTQPNRKNEQSERNQYQKEMEKNRLEYERRRNGGMEMRDDPSETSSTLIEDLPEEDHTATSDDSDRYLSRQPKAQIRTNEGSYIEGEDLFQGTPPDMRQAKKSAISTSKKGMDIMALAKQMEKGRGEIPLKT